jgi:hypothetical protein
MTATVHSPALQTTLPPTINGYDILLAVPQRDRPGQYPAWTILCRRDEVVGGDEPNEEYVVWTAYYRDDRRPPHPDAWAASTGDYFSSAWSGPTYAKDAIDQFWVRAKSAAWRPVLEFVS